MFITAETEIALKVRSVTSKLNDKDEIESVIELDVRSITDAFPGQGNCAGHVFALDGKNTLTIRTNSRDLLDRMKPGFLFVMKPGLTTDEGRWRVAPMAASTSLHKGSG